MRDFIKVTKGLSEPNRVKIIKLLQQSPMFVSELQHALGIAQPTVSKHLKVLESAGLISFHKQGTWVRYRLTNGGNSPYASSILGNLRHWLEEDPEIMRLYETRPSFSELRRLEENA
jgi:ArsR family transcriptional regulator